MPAQGGSLPFLLDFGRQVSDPNPTFAGQVRRQRSALSGSSRRPFAGTVWWGMQIRRRKRRTTWNRNRRRQLNLRVSEGQVRRNQAMVLALRCAQAHQLGRSIAIAESSDSSGIAVIGANAASTIARLSSQPKNTICRRLTWRLVRLRAVFAARQTRGRRPAAQEPKGCRRASTSEQSRARRLPYRCLAL